MGGGGGGNKQNWHFSDLYISKEGITTICFLHKIVLFYVI